ncbi:MAG TPA: efflux transporter outer membrane subunit [Candidatus Limnocylindrales bacterium]|nr:efflux transporter outer membrane subunit [Candidatus Limnocylindrales bacterium]
MSRGRLPLPTLGILCAVLAGGCITVGPDYRPPPVPSLREWNAPLQGGLEAGAQELAQWWRLLGDPVLDDLIARALAGNTDVSRAMAAVREARARRTGAIASLFPTADLSTAYQRQKRASSSASGSGGSGGSGGSFDLFSAGFDAGWEIDLFGGVRRDIEQRQGTLEAARADLRSALVSVTAEVARNYVELRSLQERIAIAIDNAESQAQTLQMTRWRFEAGLVGDLDVQQATYQLSETRARIPTLESEMAQARHRLAVLLALPAGSLDAGLSTEQPLPAAPARIAVGVPADLLRRRPDVAAAERRLAAATAAIGVATADLYPKLTLNGSLELSATSVSGLDDEAARGYGIGPSVRWNLFDAGRIRAEIAARSARADQALSDYEAAVLAAYEEGENALVAFAREQVRRDRLAHAVGAAREAERLARTQYENGVIDFQSVLEAQRARLGLEESLAVSRATVTTNLVALYKALGGGWQSDAPGSVIAATAGEEDPALSTRTE